MSSNQPLLREVINKIFKSDSSITANKLVSALRSENFIISEEVAQLYINELSNGKKKQHNADKTPTKKLRVSKDLDSSTLETPNIPTVQDELTTQTTFSVTPRPNLRFSDMAGMSQHSVCVYYSIFSLFYIYSIITCISSYYLGIDNVIEKLKELIFQPLYMRSLYTAIGSYPYCTLLLYGPAGCGKTMLVNAIAGELGVCYYKVMSILVYSV